MISNASTMNTLSEKERADTKSYFAQYQKACNGDIQTFQGQSAIKWRKAAAKVLGEKGER
jgi:hypothetical protein